MELYYSVLAIYVVFKQFLVVVLNSYHLYAPVAKTPRKIILNQMNKKKPIVVGIHIHIHIGVRNKKECEHLFSQQHHKTG